jgi:cysteine desulfurase
VRKQPQRKRVVISAIEHPALLGAAKQLEQMGAEVLRIGVGSDGRVSAASVLNAVDERTAICSLMWANNETGVIQPVAEIAAEVRKRGALFHVDAVQAAGKVPVQLTSVPADMLSLSAHKFGGPTGIGALVVRRGVDVDPLVPGHQELGRRGGTSDVARAEAFALALELSTQKLEPEAQRLSALRDAFERKVLDSIPNVSINGAGSPRIPNTSNLLFEGADGEAILIALDLEGICASSGAACASGSLSPSHVLLAMGRTSAHAHASLRFSIGPETTAEDVEKVVASLTRHVPAARSQRN